MSAAHTICRLPQRIVLLNSIGQKKKWASSSGGSFSLGFGQSITVCQSPIRSLGKEVRSPQKRQEFGHSESCAPRAYSHSMAADSQQANGASGKKPRLTIDVVSDTVCPWCFVGKKNLEQAMKASKDKYDFDVIWRPFQLNPDAPREGRNKREYYRQKFGEAKTKMIVDRLSGIFKTIGYDYNMDGLVGNSLDSHRLLEYAKEQGKQNELAEELFQNSFVRAKYIGNRDYLVEAAEKVGITGAREFLDDPDAGVQQIRDELRTYARGVSGVPHFIINGQVELSGAQAPDVMLEAFEDAASAVA